MRKAEIGRINSSIANLYREAHYRSEIISQALLAEKIFIEEKSTYFTKIKQTDDYKGWISNYQWVPYKRLNYPKKMIRSHWVKIYREPLVTSNPISEATIGVRLSVYRSTNGWLQIIMPDGQYGWIEENSFGDLLPATRINAVKLAEEFYGIPYFWGGRSARGFDCSGLMQTVFALMDIPLCRDAWMQQRDSSFISNDPQKAQPGDLYFFSDDGERITHVGLAAGNSRIIHARGMVRLNSLNSADPDFDRNLLDTFVDVRTYFR